MIRRRLDIDALRALQAVDVRGGVTRASHHLSLSQSAVSHKIRRLEESIGCRLLTRQPGAPLLTDTGERLVGYAERILSLHDEALRSLSTDRLSGEIKLGITEDTANSGLARVLGRFSRVYPDVSVRTQVAQSLTLQKQLDDGAIDVAVMQVFERDLRSDDVFLHKGMLVWVKSIDLELGDGPIPFLSYDDNCFYKQWGLEQVTTSGRAFETVLQCPSNAGIIAAVEAGLGVAILNRKYVSRGAVILTEGFVQPPEVAYVVRTSPRMRSKIATVLAMEIKREVVEFPSLDAH